MFNREELRAKHEAERQRLVEFVQRQACKPEDWFIWQFARNFESQFITYRAGQDYYLNLVFIQMRDNGLTFTEIARRFRIDKKMVERRIRFLVKHRIPRCTEVDITNPFNWALPDLNK